MPCFLSTCRLFLSLVQSVNPSAPSARKLSSSLLKRIPRAVHERQELPWGNSPSGPQSVDKPFCSEFASSRAETLCRHRSRGLSRVEVQSAKHPHLFDVLDNGCCQLSSSGGLELQFTKIVLKRPGGGPVQQARCVPFDDTGRPARLDCTTQQQYRRPKAGLNYHAGTVC
jgi:hypothetical protein